MLQLIKDTINALNPQPSYIRPTDQQLLHMEADKYIDWYCRTQATSTERMNNTVFYQV